MTLLEQAKWWTEEMRKRDPKGIADAERVVKQRLPFVEAHLAREQKRS